MLEKLKLEFVPAAGDKLVLKLSPPPPPLADKQVSLAGNTTVNPPRGEAAGIQSEGDPASIEDVFQSEGEPASLEYVGVVFAASVGATFDSSAKAARRLTFTVDKTSCPPLPSPPPFVIDAAGGKADGISSEGEPASFKDVVYQYLYQQARPADRGRLVVHRRAGNISNWNVSEITDMSCLFSADPWCELYGGGGSTTGKDMCNPDIGSWGTSSVRDIDHMFRGASSFDRDISSWDTSAVVDMSRMFRGASSFNKDISSWNTSAVLDMSEMFYYASSFNKDLSSWDTSAVVNMNFLFGGATSFDKNISSWDTSSVVHMRYMFVGASSFNQDLSSWDVSAVLYMNGMFDHATSFDKDISSWDTSSVRDMRYMFYGASSFNKDISSWDTSAVVNMDMTFRRAASFDKAISSWDVSAVTDMGGMFGETSSLSDCNKALIHASFDAQTSAYNSPGWSAAPASWGSLACPPPASPPSPPPASPTGVCGDGTALDPTGFCEVVLGSATEVLDGKCEVVLGSATEVVDGKVEIACAGNRRLEEAQEEGAQEAAAASIVDGLLARHPYFVAKLRRANLDEEAIKIMLELGQDFRLPALA